ncbi:MAG TPA: nucleotidyltransferase domain-containing protein [Mucilaginibacter sp.]|jgi:predicted nucleotidyltransferase|nr:nucleotidyltransferase domain-containing protein [Mucilaginibacter sp.]
MQDISFPLISKNLSEIKKSILTTLAYFDLFRYPLTRAEIYLFLRKKYQYDFFNDALQSLLNHGVIYQFDRFFSLKNDHSLALRRVEGNKKADELIGIARRVGNVLISFPYVRGVAVSGSLSKNFADEQSDIDLFIITAKNRVWIARTIMHFLKKLTFLVKKEHYFCMNYYIDEQELEIAEKNIYTAIEIGTLMPLEGDFIFEKFFSANNWTREYLPNKNMRVASAKPLKRRFFKRVIELVFDNSFGNSIDSLLMKITASRWQKKTIHHKLNSKGEVMAMVTGKHFSKPDPKNFQANLLLKYERKVALVMREYEGSLVH